MTDEDLDEIIRHCGEIPPEADEAYFHMVEDFLYARAASRLNTSEREVRDNMSITVSLEVEPGDDGPVRSLVIEHGTSEAAKRRMDEAMRLRIAQTPPDQRLNIEWGTSGDELHYRTHRAGQWELVATRQADGAWTVAAPGMDFVLKMYLKETGQ